MYLGIDIGGTFTDLVLMDDEGHISTAKAPTTLGELEHGVFEAVALAAAAQGHSSKQLLHRVKTFGHGTTQATNALIERTGAVTGLIATRGFGDTLALQRLMGFTAGIPVENLGWYSRRRYPEPIVPRRLVREVRERVDQAGRVLVPLDEANARQAVQDLIDAGAQTFAVALLWSFRNPAHERRIGEIIREMRPEAYVSLSCEVSPIIGEYERTATTVLNSYLAPKVANYLERVESLLRDRGFGGTFNVLNSAGGVIPAREAARKPVLLVASGPAGGVMGSLQLAQEIGHSNVITTDMGGTSFDVALVVDGRPLVSGTHEAGGFHLNTPIIDIRAIGAGGGSIARVEAGLLRVGPDSAGAVPGPVCYGRGGTFATVTDADLVLGILSPDNFLGGRMKLDPRAATEAIRAQVAEPLGMSVEEAAAGIRRVVDGHMADTLREVTIGRGHDPRDFVLLAYGGAGPAHCTGYGAELGVPRILVPATSMAHSAYGALASDIQHSAEQSLLLRGGGGTRDPWDGLDCDAMNAVFADLEARCLAAMKQSGFTRAHCELTRSIDMRYRRQTHDLMVAVPDGPMTATNAPILVERFEEAYESVYGKGAGFRFARIELTTFRVMAVARTRKPTIRKPSAAIAPQPHRRRIFEPTARAWTEAAVFAWLELPAGFRASGPAVIEHPETTVYVGPEQTARTRRRRQSLYRSRRGDAMTVRDPVRRSDTDSAIDPITFEVIRHKLEAITEEQAITLKNVSGSPVVTEATDFNVGIYLADGAIVNMGPQVIFHAGTMSTVIYSIIEHFSDNPGINEGDMFILNDPYRGAIHQPDVSIVMPLFHEGRRIAWTGSCAHELDTGGMSFGSWAFAATDVQQEAMLLPGVKIVENGTLREDIWQMIMGMTRLPHVVGLDLKAMIAANNVAARRFRQLMQRYGADTVDQVMRIEIDTSERMLRERLARIPDGIYRARDFLDHDGHANRLYQIEVAAQKRGDQLTLDMEGSSPQAPGFINCTRSGLRGALFTGLLPILAPDIRWNEGVLKPVTIKVPEANICNASWPSPVSGATVSTAWVAQNVAVAALSRMVACVPELVQEGQAVTKGQFSVMTMAGRDRDGGPFGMLLMDAMAGGGGAYIDHDGLDGSGDHSIPRPRIGNVESNEAAGPYLYLFRSFVPDTAGAGTMRGGVTAGLAITPHDTDELHTMVIGHGVQVPNSIGQFGGMPGACAYHLLRKSNADIAGLIEANAHMRDLLDADGAVQRLEFQAWPFPAASGRRAGVFIPGRRRLWRSDPPRSRAGCAQCRRQICHCALGRSALRCGAARWHRRCRKNPRAATRNSVRAARRASAKEQSAGRTWDRRSLSSDR